MLEQKLFAVYLGGRADRCNIELHDVVILDQVSQSFDVDDILEIGNVDEYFITLKPTTSVERNFPISAYVKVDALLVK
jgi:hypothetical protein